MKFFLRGARTTRASVFRIACVRAAFAGAVAGMLLSAVSCIRAIDRQKESDEVWIQKNHAVHKAISLDPFWDSINAVRKQYKNKIPPYELYEETQVVGIAESMLALQNPDGGWAKNTDWARVYSRKELSELHEQTLSVAPLTWQHKENNLQSTLDNGTIYTHVTYLCKAYEQLRDRRYLESAKKALQWILNAQHPVSGGWTGSDVYAITYNDEAMGGVLELLRAISREEDACYRPLAKELKQQAQQAYDRGIKCVLDTQIVVTKGDGTKVVTAWSQQHDHETLKPIWAREFEPPSVCSYESINLVKMLMQDKNPSPELVACIESACAWLMSDDIVIHGKKLVEVPAEPEVSKYGRYSDYETLLVDDKDAPPLLARMYDLENLQPVYCDRGRVIVKSFNDLGRERRNGYSYLGEWTTLLDKPYAEWKKSMQ